MNFDLDQSLEVLERTPSALDSLLGGISDDWTGSRGNADKWQPYDVIGHLIHGEKTDWIPRARIILSQEGNVTSSRSTALRNLKIRTGNHCRLFLKSSPGFAART